jgi:hypothetical protein
MAYALSPIALRVPLHHPRAAADHEPAAGLLRDRDRECDAGEGKRAADRQRHSTAQEDHPLPDFNFNVEGWDAKGQSSVSTKASAYSVTSSALPEER